MTSRFGQALMSDWMRAQHSYSKSSVLHVSAPGKVILSGEHAVVYGKLGIACAIGLRTHVYLYSNPSFGHNFKLHYQDIGVDVIIDLNKLKHLNISCAMDKQSQEESMSLINKFVSESIFLTPNKSVQSEVICIVCYLFYALILNSVMDIPLSLDISIKSEIPLGKGLGASAAMAVALVTAFSIYGGTVSTRLTDISLTYINDYANFIENYIHGKASGIDNSVSCFGGFIQYRAGKISNLKMDDCVILMCIDSGMSKSTRQAVANVSKLKALEPELFQQCIDTIDTISGEIVDTISASGLQDHEIYARLSVLVRAHQAQQVTLGVSSPLLDELVAICARFGLAAKVTGAGCGGHVICLIPPNDSFGHAALSDFLASGGYVHRITRVSMTGVTVHSPSESVL